MHKYCRFEVDYLLQWNYY